MRDVTVLERAERLARITGKPISAFTHVLIAMPKAEVNNADFISIQAKPETTLIIEQIKISGGERGNVDKFYSNSVFQFADVNITLQISGGVFNKTESFSAAYFWDNQMLKIIEPNETFSISTTKAANLDIQIVIDGFYTRATDLQMLRALQTSWGKE